MHRENGFPRRFQKKEKLKEPGVIWSIGIKSARHQSIHSKRHRKATNDRK
jgi:hypothetical protein